MRRSVLIAATVAAGALTASAASAQTFATVDALANSTTGGAPLVTTLNLVQGQRYYVSQNPLDLWASGDLPRYSDGNGIVDRVAVAGDDSGQTPGTQIGSSSFGQYTQGNLTANYGSLVAVYGPGQFQFVGGNSFFVAAQSGALALGYFDSNNLDNVGSINFRIDAVPEPAAWAMMLVGFGAAGIAMRRRKTGALRTA